MPRSFESSTFAPVEGSHSDDVVVKRPFRSRENGYRLKAAEQADSDTPESLSPTADLLEASAARIVGFLRNRAESQQLRAQQDETYASYSENISATRIRESQEFRDNAKERARGFGRAALSRLKRLGAISSEAVLVTAGGGILAGEKAMSGLDKLDDYAVSKASQAGDYIKDKATDVANAVTTKVESGAEAVADWTSEKYAQTREAYIANREIAKQRRATRREAWAAKRAEIGTSIRSTYERNKARVDVARGVGSVVVSHLSEVYGQLKDTKNVARTAKDELDGSRQL